MKVYIKIALVVLLVTACTKGSSGSSTGGSMDSKPEQGSASEVPVEGEPGSSSPEGNEKPATDPAGPGVPEPGNGTPLPTPTTTPAPTAQATTEFGLLNFRQYMATVSTLTGVKLNVPAAPGGDAPASSYGRALANLAKSNSLSHFSPATVIAMLNIAATYCDVLANDSTLLQSRFPNLSLADVPADTAIYATNLVDGFYGPETSLQGLRSTDIAHVATAVDTLKTLPDASGLAIFMATCAALLVSGEVVIF